jgi:serralysin
MPDFTITGLTTGAQTLNANEAGEVLLNGSLVTTASSVILAGDNATFINRGTVISQIGSAVLGNAASASIVNAGFMSSQFRVIFSDNTAFGSVAVTNSGTIAASSVNSEGIYVFSGGLVLTNSGSITTFRDSAVRAELGSSFEANTIVNSGLISNTGGLSFDMSGDADSITNTGTIIGDMQLGGGANRLRNAGQIEGSVTSGAEVDTFDLRGGFVSGLINAGAGNDNLLGGANDDRLVGDDGADTITTNGGDDALSGGDGNDTLSGGTGNDVLAGGLGVDRLTGGAGADAFDYNTVGTSITGARDVIAEFLRGTDDIDLAGIDARAGQGGNQAFSFIGTAAFSAEGQVRIIDQGANVVVQANRSGSLAADFEVMVLGVGTLAAADFLL